MFVWKLIVWFFLKTDVWLENFCFAQVFSQEYPLLHTSVSCHLHIQCQNEANPLLWEFLNSEVSAKVQITVLQFSPNSVNVALN